MLAQCKRELFIDKFVILCYNYNMQLVCIGGGDKTLAIKNGLERSNGSNVLLVPSACSTLASHNKKVGACLRFFEQFGIVASVLHGAGTAPSAEESAHKFGAASLVYTIGGNMPTLQRRIDEYDIRRHYLECAPSTVLAGTSAGALLPFKLGQSCVAARPSEVEWEYEYCEGLGIVPAVAAVHANQIDPTPSGPRNMDRFGYLINSFPAQFRHGIALDDDASVLIDEQTGVVIKSSANAQVRLLRSTNSGVVIESAENSFRVSDFTLI